MSPRAVAVGVLGSVALLAGAAGAQVQPPPPLPPPQPPAPSQPYPQQQYPQQQYPQQQYPQQHSPGQAPPSPQAGSQPVAKEPSEAKGESPKDKLPSYDGAYDFVLGLAGARLDVNMDTRQSTQALGGFVDLNAFGYRDYGAFTFHFTGFTGWGSGSLEGRGHADFLFGAGVPAAEGGEGFFEIGASSSAFKNDELDANLITLPTVMVGYQQHFEGFGFQLAPKGGLALRGEWNPGDEEAGRRMHRGVRKPIVDYGGTVSVATKYFLINGSVTRLVGSDPLTTANGQACLLVSVLAACGFVDYWKSSATTTGALPQPAVTRDVDVTYVGFSLGFGVSGAELAKDKDKDKDRDKDKK